MKKEDTHGRHDVVFLQETHVEQDDVGYMTKLHAQTWGFRVGQGCPQLSFWSPSRAKKGGVAILIDPYGEVKAVTPALEAHWSPHFMAVEGTRNGIRMMYVCIYAPHRKGPREEFFWDLLNIEMPTEVNILVGGDFNCTQDARLDRSHFRQHSDHESAALAELMSRWGVVDAVAQPTESEINRLHDYYARTHTYWYKLLNGEPASARLDRWYTSAALIDSVVLLEVCYSGARGDHQAVRLHLSDPRDPIRIRKPARVYPPPPCARLQVQEATVARLVELQERLTHREEGAAELAEVWETTKTMIRVESLKLIKQRRKMNRATYKQKCRRLLKQERRLLEAAAGAVATVESITDSLDAMTLTAGRGATPLQRVRSAITECLRGRLAQRQRRLFQQTGHQPGKTTRGFFRRVSAKFGDSVIHRLDAATGHQERGVHEQPDTIADAWTSIFQQAPSSAGDRQEVLKWLGNPDQYAAELADLTEPFTEDEVAAAIRGLKTGKACGPDRLGNDWYRDFASYLVPVMTILFNCWYQQAIFPTSFLEADVFCLKKGGGSRDPLNFRPLSLMNSDYKLITRMLATRSSRKLPAIIHPNQNGFVPLRTIHATLDLFTAAQMEAQRNPEFAAALALLLDFCKAYDSVDREFLYAVLLWLGFPMAFVAAIRAMHAGTRVRFLANGFRSRWVDVLCGIRQGCPLAPLLFILVLEALYRRIDRHPRLCGITLRSRAGAVRLTVGGYADDTASYAKTPQEVPIVMGLTRQFALASGLKLNEGKTLVIALNPDFCDSLVALPPPLRLQEPDQLSRYLGIPVGSRPDVTHTWDLAHTQLTTRLALAMQKTTTVDQRCLIVAAIVIPKLLYIGRHHWPTSSIVATFQRRIHNYVWHAQFTVAKLPGKAWMNCHVAALPRAQGGMGYPLLKTELLAMAAVEVTNWAVLSTQTSFVIGDVIADADRDPAARQCIVAPRLLLAARPDHSLGPSLWEAGARIAGMHGGTEASGDKAAMVAALNCLNYFTDAGELMWSGRTFIMRIGQLSGSLSERYMAAEELKHGSFCEEWVPYLVLRTLRLYAPDGAMVNPNTQYRLLCNLGDQVKDVVHWSWTLKGNLKVTALTTQISGAIRRQLGHLMRLLVLNFPHLMRRGQHDGRIRYLAGTPDHRPIRRVVTTDLEVKTPQTEDACTETVSAVHSHGELERYIQGEVGPSEVVRYVHPHPRLSRLVCLWIGRRRWKVTRAHFKAQINKRGHARGLTVRTKAQKKWERLSSSAVAGLRLLSWQQLRRIVGLNPWGEQLLYRLKHHALSVYNPVSAGLCCPHPECSRRGRVDLHHVFWGCPAAVSLRHVMLTRWQAAGVKIPNCEQAFFSLTMTEVPSGVRQAIGNILADCPDEDIGQVGDAVERISARCWSLGAALYFHSVWRWRVAFFDPHNDVTMERHVAFYAARLRSGHADIVRASLQGNPTSTQERIGRVICSALGAHWMAPLTTTVFGEHVVVVFHTGSVAPETGQGCSGVVITRVHEGTGQGQVLFLGGRMHAGTMKSAHKANQLALLRGLRICRRNGWGSVQVVGDDSIVHRQHERRTPPRAAALQAVYWTARRTADAVGVIHWMVVPRERNRTAHEILRVVIATSQDVEWNARDSPLGGAKWAAVTAYMHRDVRYCRQVSEEATRAPAAQGAV